MKKILTAIVLFAFVVLPMSVMAMTSVTEDELSTVTGQAGVSINVDVTANVTVGTLGWGDENGFTGYSNMGFVGIEGMNLNVHISGRHDGDFSTGGATDIGYLRNKPITIDVGTNGTGATLVRIGIPTAEIIVSTLQTDIFVSGGTLAGGPTSTTAQQLGSIYMSGINVKMGQSATPADGLTYDAGYVTIGAAGAGNVGVNIGFNIAIDSVEIGTISYGNTTSILAPSFGAAATAGYVGVTGLNLDNVNLVGGAAIGVGTLNFDALTGETTLGTHTQVNIIIANGTTVSIPGAITGRVIVAQAQTLTTGAETLGNFYIGGIVAQIVDNVGSLSAHSLIQVWAH